MAKTVSEEEIQLRKRARRRLVGAITLVVTAVVILPMVLDSKPEQRSHEIDIRIPSEDSVEELAPEAAIRTEAPPRTVPEKLETGIRQEEPVASEPSVKPAQPANESIGKPAANSMDSKVESGAGNAKATVPAAAANVFVVQLGAFSDPGKARQQLQSVTSKDSRSKAYTETLKVDGGADKGEITRVRVGPFDTREEAERTREKLKKLGFDGVVAEK
jgi:DedD protein